MCKFDGLTGEMDFCPVLAVRSQVTFATLINAILQKDLHQRIYAIAESWIAETFKTARSFAVWSNRMNGLIAELIQCVIWGFWVY